MRNPNIKESKPHSYRWWELSEGFKFNIKMLRTVKQYRNVLWCSWKLGAPGPKHAESKAVKTHGNEGWEVSFSMPFPSLNSLS